MTGAAENVFPACEYRCVLDTFCPTGQKNERVLTGGRSSKNMLGQHLRLNWSLGWMT